jgi:putative transposase
LRSNLLRGGALKEHRAGLSVAELGRKHGIRRPAGVCLQTPKGNDAALYKGRTKYGGMEVFEAKHLKQL